MSEINIKIHYTPLEEIIKNEISLIDFANKKILYNDFPYLYEYIISRDTKKEVELIYKVIQTYKPDTKTLLDLGCGVGRHLRELNNLGYNVTGIDKSVKMIDEAKINVPLGLFYNKDYRDFDLKQKYDVIICMWSTFNYLSDKNDIINYFKTISKHLKKNGIFIVDLWNYKGLNQECYQKEFSCQEYSIKQVVYKKIVNKYCDSIYYYIIYDNIKNTIIYAIDQEINIKYTENEMIELSSDKLRYINTYGNYDGEEYDENNSDRLIMVFQR